LGLPAKRDEWTFSNLPRNSEPQLKDLKNAEMAVVNFNKKKRKKLSRNGWKLGQRLKRKKEDWKLIERRRK
jgi:hypothetical protein